MTRINQLPATTTPIMAADLLEGERVNGESQKWTQAQVVGGYAPMACRVYLVTDRAVANGTDTLITWDAEEYDDFGMHAAGQVAKVTIPANGGGLWLISVALAWYPSGAGQRIHYMRVNGATINRLGMVALGPNASGDTIVNSTVMTRLNANDYLEVVAYQSSGGALNISGAFGANGPKSTTCHWSLARLGT